ncbi:MAG: cell division ATP-binding protein FtsE [Gammaproteobacteria bacterium]|nr:cell division ATP-binding protein FtsE [Gammaproteobacteria bacterium]
MIELSQVTKKYSNGFEAIKNLSLSIEKGEMVFLTGHSGAGKSTLLKLITHLEKPTRGQITVAGDNLTKLKLRHIPRLRRKLGVVFQNPQLLPKKTLFENVALPLLATGSSYKECAKSVRASLDMVGLLGKEKQYPPTLSTGEQQRAGIARAIINRPQILLADEPTGNLDPELSAEIMHLFEKLHQVGTTALIASHDLALIASMHHRILTLDNGVLINDQKIS